MDSLDFMIFFCTFNINFVFIFDKRGRNNVLNMVLLHIFYSFYKWTKHLTLEMTMFGLKMMVKSGPDFFFIYFEILRAPSELLLPSAKKSAQKG